MKIDRRRALALLGLGAATPALAQRKSWKDYDDSHEFFQHGVASGDPLADRLIIWTRVTAEGPQAVEWQVATEKTFRRPVAKGTFTASPDRDHTVKVDVTGLKPGTEYWYRFSIADGGPLSPTGRARTLPVGPTKDVVLAVASCTLYPNGYFNAYRAIADLPRVDAVLHLGDYIYEYGGPGSYGMDSAVAAERPHDPPHECVSLADYRRRHAQYKADPHSQAAHARAAWITSWDDHETANDSFMLGAQNHQPATEGDWNVRKAAALRAYFEWMPIREPAAGQSQIDAAMRSFHFGDLASLIMVETRLSARDGQLVYERDIRPGPDGKPDVASFRTKLADPSRKMMGPAQEAWIAGELARSVAAGHAWQVLGNQVVMARVIAYDPNKELTAAQLASLPEASRRRVTRNTMLSEHKLPVGLDMWDGYPADRERLYGVMRQAGARPIVVSGDSHSFWANELHDDQGRRVACEFGTTGITSPGAGEVVPGLNAGVPIARANDEVVFNDQVSKGFVLLTLNRDEARGDMVAVSTIVAKDFTTRVVKSFRTRPEGKGLSQIAEV